jgi:hypothetical protein
MLANIGQQRPTSDKSCDEPCHAITLPPPKRDQVHTLLGPIGITLVGLPPVNSYTIFPSFMNFSGLAMARLGHSSDNLKSFAKSWHQFISWATAQVLRAKSSRLARFLQTMCSCLFRLSALHSWCAFSKPGAWLQQHCPFREADQSLLCQMHLAIAVVGLAVHPCQDCRRGIDGAMLASS